MRKLASIQKILSLSPIEWADRIELAEVLWRKVIVQKWLYNVWDLVIYIEIDSFLPEKPMFEFLRKSSFKTFEGNPWFRVRTMKMKWVVSQWLCILLDECWITRWNEWDDVTDKLWIVKYDTEKEVEVKNKARFFKKSRYAIVNRAHYLVYLVKKMFKKETTRTFPAFIPKTDETRVQVMMWILHDNPWEYVAHEKLDWSSVTCYKYKWKFHVCSRNLEIPRDKTNNFRIWIESSGVENEIQEWEAWQWELIWPGVQENKYKLAKLEIRRFQIFDIQQQKYKNIFWSVPFVRELTITWETTVDRLVSLATIKSQINPDVWAEWIVIRPKSDVYWTRWCQMWRLSFKVINPEFLLQYDA